MLSKCYLNLAANIVATIYLSGRLQTSPNLGHYSFLPHCCQFLHYSLHVRPIRAIQNGSAVRHTTSK